MEEDVRSPMFAAQPFEESQGVELSPVASPQELDAFYKDMEIKETLERQLSKRSRIGTNIWSRRSAKRSSTAPPVANPVQTSPSNHQRLSSELETNGREAGEWLMDNQDFRNSYQSSKIQSPRSILPDSTRDPWSSIPLPASTKQYNIHNPLGPRWYKNHHLIPPGEKKPTARPPTFFSPSFPGMTTSSQERFEEGPLAGPSRTPSGSPLPTPNSSQTRVFDNIGKPRIRKTSQTAHDNVDLMDPTDPWGTHWHHKSPYDIGLANEPISIDLQGGAAYSRGRRASMSTQSRNLSMKPSPLSQSTSAVNLSTPRDFVQMPRKLSKRRTANGNIFGGSQSIGHSSGPSLFKTRPASVDSARPPMSGYHPSMTSLDSKKEKRGSFLNRLGRKLSILKRRSQDEMKPPEPIVPDEWHHVGESFAPPRTSPDFRQHEPEPEPERQSPPPEQESIPFPEPEPEPEPSPPEDRPTPIQLHDPGFTPAPPVEKSLLFPDQQSVLSVEPHFSIGKLTVANPDTPESEHNTPAHNDVPLPEPTQEPAQRDTQYSTMSNVTYMLRNSLLEKDILLNLSLEKTLPPPPPIELTPNPASISLQHTYTPQTTLSTLTQAQTNLSAATYATHASSSAASFTTQATGKNTQLLGADSKPDATPGPSKRASQQITNSPAVRSIKSPESFSTAPLPPFAAASPAPPSWVSINLTNFDTPPLPNRISLDHTATPPPPATDKRSSHRPSPIPFPTADDSLPNIPSEYDYSPYSATSVLANPPTPLPPRDIPVPKTKEKEKEYKPSPLSQPQNNHTRKKSTHANNHEPPSVTRLTETFKLVRNPSGNVQTRNTATMAGGDQWEVVGSHLPTERNGKEKPSKLEKKRDKSVRESRTTESRGNDSPVSPISPTSPIRESREREKKRESRSRGESENREHRHDRERSERTYHDHASREQREREYAERERQHREREYAEREREKREREYAEREYRERQRERERRSKEREREEKSAAKEHKSRDRHRDSKEASSSSRQESRHTAEASSSTQREREHRSRKHDDRADRQAAEAAVAAVKARGSSPDNLVRRTSSSTRPTSQLPSAAELNALRAREAWEMERLWKARSINGESSGFAISGYGSPNFAAIDGLIPTGVIHGTNHTTFVVQAPFIPNNTIYHSMPPGPAPIVYPSPPVVTTTKTTTTITTNKLKKEKASKASDPERKQRKHHSVSAVPAADSNKPLPPVLRPPNPLPAPPRDSFHDAKPFPQMNGNKRSSENWTPVAGVTISN